MNPVRAGRLGEINYHPQANPHSSRPVYQDVWGLIHQIRCLTIKVRYFPTYPLADPPPPNHIHGLEELLFQVFQSHHGGLTVELAKTKRLLFDMTQPVWGVEVPVREFF